MAARQNLLSSADLVGALGVPEVDAAVGAALDGHLDGLVASLERRLGRALWVRQITERFDERWWPLQTTLYGWDALPVSLRPVRSIDAITIAGTVLPGPYDPIALRVFADQPLEVTYTAGLDPDPQIRMMLALKAAPFVQALTIAAASLAGQAASAGGDGMVVPVAPASVSQFFVEGLNVTYRSATDLQDAAIKTSGSLLAAALWTDGELAALGKLRRIVVA